VTLGVYDLLGRQVARLVNGHRAAGNYQESWNGRDNSGNQVRSGVYFYRLRAGNEVRTARTMLVTK
jgi:flagellar hook assembly protein FlgD